MQFVDLDLPTPAENLACDEALLDHCEETGDDEILRIWESPQYFVVVGYANRVDLEVNQERCRARGIPILRRCSGGGTVVQGPGCLNYSLVLKASKNDALQTVTQTNQFIMERHRALFQSTTGKGVEVQGHTDLAMGGFKFSGNAQRRRKDHFLFHGAFLLNFDLGLIQDLLKMPSKQPHYRENRRHEDFLTNLELPSGTIKDLLRRAWMATNSEWEIPDTPAALLEKYQSDEWNLKF